MDKGCVRGFNVWNYPTNETQLPSTQGLGFMNTQNYDQIVEIRKEGRGNVSPEEQITFIQSPSATGFYVGIQDVGGCVSITRLRVYRNNCKSRQLGLVLYPDAPAPVSNSANIDVSCVENAVVSGSAVATCASDGTWGPERPVCQCQLGYIENLEPPECNGKDSSFTFCIWTISTFAVISSQLVQPGNTGRRKTQLASHAPATL